MATLSKLRRINATPVKSRTKIERKLLQRAREAFVAAPARKFPVSWGAKKPLRKPTTAADRTALERAAAKRERKAEKLAAQGFGTVAFHMPGTAEVLRNLVANSDMQVPHV